MSSEASGGASRRSSQNSKADSKGHQATAGPKSLYVQKKKDPLLLCEEVINVLKSRNVQVKRISTGATAAGDAGGAVEENGFILEERYRGITGRLMVPNYAGQHVPSLEQEKAANSAAPSGHTKWRASDFRNPEIVTSLSKGRPSLEDVRAMESRCGDRTLETKLLPRGTSSRGSDAPFWF
eukprot:gnl/TRDRNA2_/TRDRNA2_133694_c0_seq2.p1 gnl/TRDRNA2_/TRDRNA2_133694_c0~~gnl/TRDRNA2_/TRDRNA2_133694_c0_seq2.p1  ORF type:complete len:194 (+),score=36.51 gnl/TRDRNA2_/TRDRNA2_133694_c0_seq2:41-583(+)